MKLIKFDLPINGIKAKNLDELRDNLTDEILTLARSGQLERWLRTRQLPEQAQAVATAVRSEGTDKGLFLALCKLLEVDVHLSDLNAIFDAPPAPAPRKIVHDAIPTSNSRRNSLKKLKLTMNFTKPKDQSIVQSATSLVVLSGSILLPGGIDKYLGGKKWIVSKVFAKKGSLIRNGESIIEFGDKLVTYEMSSSVMGIVEEVFVHVGQKAYINQDLISISESES